MCKSLYVAVFCYGVACCEFASGMSAEDAKQIADSLGTIGQVGKNLATVAESSRPESSLQETYKYIGQMYRKLNGTPEFEKWCEENPVSATLLKTLDWLGQ